jgi:DNA/RNA endonuclease G (NUC1)
VGFSPLLKLPRWVAYRIVTGKSFAREPGEFMPDPALPAAYQALSSDYSGNDFDRGHLVRRQDLFGLGRRAAREVSYLTAVVPQLSYVNRRIWFALEDYASAKAGSGREVYIIRGPVYAPAAGSTMVNVTLMGASLVPVPTHFFQILAIVESGTMTVEAHLIPNSYVPLETGDVAQFRASVRSIAQKTGLQLDVKLLT